MKRLCVFCGKPPTNKNKEHVIPRWLLRLTGDPRRTANFGVRYFIGTLRQFSFDKLTFRACAQCNGNYSELEAPAQRIVIEILNSQRITAEDVFILLDWLDKVRIGFWLGTLTLNDNAFGIEPKFFISQRVGAHDRMISVFLDSYRSTGLTLSGPFTSAFAFLPSCFAIRINNLYLFNASCPFMVSKNCGFPFSVTVNGRGTDGKYVMEFDDGRQKLGSSILDLPAPPWQASATICQPIFREALPDNKEGYDREHIRNHSRDWDRGLGSLILERNDGLKLLGNDEISLPLLNDSMNYWKLLHVQVLVTQNYLLTIPPNKPTDEQGLELWNAARSLNDVLISRSID